MSDTETFKKIFEGLAYTIIEDDEATIVFLEGKPIQVSCIEHGSHQLFDLNCPHAEKLLKKIFS